MISWMTLQPAAELLIVDTAQLGRQHTQGELTDVALVVSGRKVDQGQPGWR